MENKLMLFENEAFGKVRTLNLNGEPWFVAVDVCSVLDLSNPTIAVSRLDEDERAKFNLGRQLKLICCRVNRSKGQFVRLPPDPILDWAT